MNYYESVLIFSPEMSSEQVDTEMQQIKKFIEEQKGSLILVDKWGIRRTAYPLDKFREGLYVVLQHSCEPSVIQELEKMFRLNKSILRHLIVRLDPARIKINEVSEPKKEEVTSDENTPVARAQ